MRSILLTDLDGTLLDAHTYDWSPARAALDGLARAAIPVIICTSKTRAEVEALRRELGHCDPFVIENGGAIYVPAGYFNGDRVAGTRHDGYDVIELGVPYPSLVEALGRAACAANVAVRGWRQMDVSEVARRCEMTIDAARLAMAREYDEPFVVADERPEVVARLAAAIASAGGRLTRGDRFFHIMGPHDKADAARTVVSLYEQRWGTVRTIAIGDAPNDVAMLALADVPIVIASPQAADVVARVPRAHLTTKAGPAGWNDAVLELLAPHSSLRSSR